jgi:hypothetical protein
MKMEFCGTGNKKGRLEMFRPGEMTVEAEEKVNHFLFPKEKYADEVTRRTEIQINNQYRNRATIFVFFKGTRILATCRIIAKVKPEDILPIEVSEVTSITDPKFSSYLNKGSPFSASLFPDALPSCELGGLRAIESTTDTAITMRERYEALSSVLLASETVAIQQGFKVGFLTCVGTQNLKKLYEERFGFKEIAEVNYGDSARWKALYRHR